MSPEHYAETLLIEISRAEREALQPPACMVVVRLKHQWAVADYLHANPRTTASAIAHSTGMSVRTVYRAIAALRQAGMRIDAASGFGYLVR